MDDNHSTRGVPSGSRFPTDSQLLNAAAQYDWRPDERRRAVAVQERADRLDYAYDERHRALLILDDGLARVADWTGITPVPPLQADHSIGGRFVRDEIATELAAEGLVRFDEFGQIGLASITDAGRRLLLQGTT